MIWTDVLERKGPITRAKAKVMETANKSVPAMNNSTLTPVNLSTAARAPVKPMVASKRFVDHLAAEQARVEAEMSRLQKELERTKVRLRNSSSDWDSFSEQLLSIVLSVSAPTTIGATQDDGSLLNWQRSLLSPSKICKR